MQEAQGRKIEDWRYKQKEAELWLSILNLILTVAIFLLAFAGNIVSTSTNVSLNINIWVVVLVIAVILIYVVLRKYLYYYKFILDAEERILSEPKIENVKIENEDKEDSDKEKRCPLSLNDWVIFLNNEINNLESGESQKSNIFFVIAALFATAASAIVSWVLSTVSIANPPQNAIIKIPLDDIISIIHASFYVYVVISLFFIFFVGYWSYQMIWVYPKNKKIAHDLKDIIKSIINGDLKDTNKVRKEWELVLQSSDKK